MRPRYRLWLLAAFILCSIPFALQHYPTLRAEPASQTADPVLVGAGDIANCNRTQDEATAQLLDGIAGTVFTLGDNVYPDGTLAQFNDCYGPTWGRHKARTQPAVGNHDYHVTGAAGYYTYFGAAASPLESNCTSDCLGYYSYNLGAWHIIVLNSEIARDAGSAQVQWLRGDLAANPSVCTLAYWHKPRFSSGNHGSNSSVQAFWQALYEYGADVVLSGHDHTYERFAPQNPSGQADPTQGIRQFVVGTGGAGLYPFPTIVPNSEVRNNTSFGVLKVTLHATSYNWEFVPVAGQTFTDAGSANCVSAGPPPTPTETATPGPTPTPGLTPTPTPQPSILTFTPTDDATINQKTSKKNFGSAATITIDQQPMTDFLMKFSVSGVNGRPITQAKLRLYVKDASDKGGDFYWVSDNSWSEATVTWGNAPVASGAVLASLGAVTINNWYEVDLSSLITADGVYSLRVTSLSTDVAEYASSEDTAQFRPQMVVVMDTAQASMAD